MPKSYVDAYEGKLVSGSAITVNNNDNLTKVFTSFGGYMNGAYQPALADMAALYADWQTDIAT